LRNLDLPVSFLVSEAFFWWTLESAAKFGFPRLVSFSLSTYAMTVGAVMAINGVLKQGLKVPSSYCHVLCHGPDTVTVPGFPWNKANEDEFDGMFPNQEADPIAVEFVGAISKSFVGPLSLVQPPNSNAQQHNPESFRDDFHQWLEEKLEKRSGSVLYVAFGTQAKLSSQQIREIAKGLEDSNVNFLWVIRNPKDESAEECFPDGFENRVKNRGIVVRDWVDQTKMSYQRWGADSGVAHALKAKMVVEELKVGLRVETCDGSVTGFVKSEALKKTVELMEGEMGKEVRKKARKVADTAKRAIEEAR
ncbi:UDP-glucuronosyl/UDP-glucosyltransferase, partial [Parasponia andersonii]